MHLSLILSQRCSQIKLSSEYIVSVASTKESCERAMEALAAINLYMSNKEIKRSKSHPPQTNHFLSPALGINLGNTVVIDSPIRHQHEHGTNTLLNFQVHSADKIIEPDLNEEI